MDKVLTPVLSLIVAVAASIAVAVFGLGDMFASQTNTPSTSESNFDDMKDMQDRIAELEEQLAEARSQQPTSGTSDTLSRDLMTRVANLDRSQSTLNDALNQLNSRIDNLPTPSAGSGAVAGNTGNTGATSGGTTGTPMNYGSLPAPDSPEALAWREANEQAAQDVARRERAEELRADIAERDRALAQLTPNLITNFQERFEMTQAEAAELVTQLSDMQRRRNELRIAALEEGQSQREAEQTAWRALGETMQQMTNEEEGGLDRRTVFTAYRVVEQSIESGEVPAVQEESANSAGGPRGGNFSGRQR